MHKVFVLLSGGVDSTTTLAIAREEFPNDEIEAITVDYGQRHKKEAECAAKQAELYNASHHILPMQGILTGMLVDKEVNDEIPKVSYEDLPVGISPTYVSFRNGFMLSLLAARAQAWVMEQEKLGQGDGSDDSRSTPPTVTIYIGVHADDGVNWAYPDCTPEFIGAMANAIYIGTYEKVRLRAPLQYYDKVMVIRHGTLFGVDYEHTWSCYVGGEEHCGQCPTCRSRKGAFEALGLKDPVPYAEEPDVMTA